jgi:hypothetical protein
LIVGRLNGIIQLWKIKSVTLKYHNKFTEILQTIRKYLYKFSNI